MSRRRLYLMRHAETAYFSDPHVVHGAETPLSARGREQAAAAGEALKDIRFDRIVTSGTRRANDTASVVTGRDPSDFVIYPELREIDGGRLDEMSSTEIDRVFSTFLRGVGNDDDTFFGGERIGDLLARIFRICEDIRTDPGWETAIAVLHGVVNRAILSWAIMGAKNPLFLGGIEQGPSCVNILDVGPDDVLVRLVNYCPWDPLHTASRASTMEGLRATYERRHVGVDARPEGTN